MSTIERKLVSIRQIDDVQPIENADAIELVVIGGWKAVTKKNEFKVGEKCVYFEVDSFLRDGVPAWQFLVDKSSREFEGERGHRLRTIKLRGQISQGLVLKLDAFPEVVQHLFALPEDADIFEVDLTELLGVKKWEAPLAPELAGQAEGVFPSWMRRTDQERCQNLVPEIFQYEDHLVVIDDLKPEQADQGALATDRIRIVGENVFSVRKAKAKRNAKYEITMKMDGSSATFFHRDGEIGVCSRNLQLKVNEENAQNTFVRMLFDGGLNWALPKYGNIAVQGELMGPGIQENRENLKDFTLFIFEVQLLDEGRNMTQKERIEFANDLARRGVNMLKVKHAPILVRDGEKLRWVHELSELPDESMFTLEELGLTDVQALLKFAEGPSIVHAVREGVVFKREDGEFSFKAISNMYLAKEKD